ncbi:MAG: 50S ribosomal protein L25 [Myxococcales bacterium]|nr:50S ribosomal protein L25 [Myxococcales bacterium]
MSEYGQITVKVRSKHGKGVARQLRRSGLCPAVMYGKKGENLSLVLDPHLFHKATDPARNLNTLFMVTVERDGAESQVVPCMVADIQRDAIKDHLLHVDFLRVDLDEQVERQIPVRYHGRSAGVAKGGKLKTFRRFVRISAKPGQFPEELAVDLTPLDAGQTLRISDMSLEGATFQERPESPLALVEAPKAKKEEAVDPKAAKKGGKK